MRGNLKIMLNIDVLSLISIQILNSLLTPTKEESKGILIIISLYTPGPLKQGNIFLFYGQNGQVFYYVFFICQAEV